MGFLIALACGVYAGLVASGSFTILVSVLIGIGVCAVVSWLLNLIAGLMFCVKAY